VSSGFISTLALFGEGTRGLAGGVATPIFCREGDVSSLSTGVSEATNVCDVLVRAATTAVGTSSSSSLRASVDNIKSKIDKNIRAQVNKKKGTYELMRDSRYGS
jgi:hypothetical protein